MVARELAARKRGGRRRGKDGAGCAAESLRPKERGRTGPWNVAAHAACGQGDGTITLSSDVKG